MRVSVLFGSASLAAIALTHPGTAAAQPDEAGTVDEIIVTAQKREQSLQDVPIVVTAVSGRLMRDAGVRDIKDLQLLTPGLLVTSTTGENVTTARIRGVGTVGDNPGLESSVGVVIDGVYRPRNGVSFGDLGPLDRIEVLKGPQGTLFGKNTSAGVINILSARPGPKLAAQSEASIGNYGAFAGSQSVSGPISDTLGAGLYVAVRRREGFYDVDTDNLRANRRSDSQNQNFWTARAQVLYTPTPDVDLRVIADYTRRKEDCCVSVGINANPTQAIVNALAGTKAADSNPFERVAYSDRGTPQDVEDKGISAQLDWDTGWADAKLTAITALRKWTSRNGIDGDFSLADLIYRDTDGSFFTGFDQFSQELRLAGTAGNLTWLVGGFFSSEQLDYRASFLYGRDLEPYFGLAFSGGRNPALVSQLAGVAPGLIVPGTGQVDAFRQDSKSYALFTNDSYTLGKLELTLGLRYTIENKEMDARYDNRGGGAACAATLARAAQVQAALGAAGATQYLGAICAPFSDPGFNHLDTHQERDEKEWSGTVKAAYRFNPQLLAYVSYARGYKAGGFNLDRARITIGVPNPDTSFPGEFVDSYEAGIKSTLFGRSLLANASAFYQKYKDFQLNTFTGVSFVVTPIPKVVSRGVDADFVWFTPLHGLSFQGGVTYAETEYGNFTPGPGISFRLPGARMSFAPLWSGSLSGTYEQPVADDLVMRTNLSAKYTSSYNTGSDLAPGKRQKALTLVNARIGFGPKDEAWTVEAWAQNLTDEHYYQVVFDATLQTGQLNAFLGAPRTYGMTLRLKY
jgi:outer membrane receptor protein involved in Fe transport